MIGNRDLSLQLPDRAWDVSRIPADWYEKCWRRFMVGFHVPDEDQIDVDPDELLRDFDADAFVQAIADSGAQHFAFYAKSHAGNSYYPTQVGHQHGIVRQGRDIFAEMIDACLTHGIVPGYLYECQDQRVMTDKPGWCQRVVGEKESLPCFLSPYRQYVLGQLEEVFTHYPTFQIFLDMVDFPIRGPEKWECPYCQERFIRDFGHTFEGEDSLTPAELIAYHDWRVAYIEEFLAEVRGLRDRLAPNALLEHNFHGHSTTGWGHTVMQTARQTDTFTCDLFVYTDGELGSAWRSKLFRTHSPKRPVVLLDTTVNIDCYDFVTPKPLPSYIAEVGSILANGVAYYTSIFIDHTGAWDKPSMETISGLNRAMAARSPWYESSKSAVNIMLVFPERTRNVLGGRNIGPCQGEFDGWVQLLAHNHFLYDVMVDEGLPDIDLSKYSALILPDAACLNDEQMEAVRAYVARGGALLATGRTSLFDSQGIERSEFALSDVFGVSYLGQGGDGRDFMVLENTEYAETDLTHTNWLLVKDDAQDHSILEVAPTTAETLIPVGKNRYRMTPARCVTDEPALTVNRFGQGTAFYLAAKLGIRYAKCGYEGMLRLVDRLLEPHRRTQSALLEGPRSVLLEAGALPNGSAVAHLVNWNDDRGPCSTIQHVVGGAPFWYLRPRMPRLMTTHNIRVGALEVDVEYSRAYLAPDMRDLPITRGAGRAWVTVPEITDYQIVVFEP